MKEKNKSLSDSVIVIGYGRAETVQSSSKYVPSQQTINLTPSQGDQRKRDPGAKSFTSFQLINKFRWLI